MDYSEKHKKPVSEAGESSEKSASDPAANKAYAYLNRKESLNNRTAGEKVSTHFEGEGTQVDSVLLLAWINTEKDPDHPPRPFDEQEWLNFLDENPQLILKVTGHEVPWKQSEQLNLRQNQELRAYFIAWETSQMPERFEKSPTFKLPNALEKEKLYTAEEYITILTPEIGFEQATCALSYQIARAKPPYNQLKAEQEEELLDVAEYAGLACPDDMNPDEYVKSLNERVSVVAKELHKFRKVGSNEKLEPMEEWEIEPTKTPTPEQLEEEQMAHLLALEAHEVANWMMRPVQDFLRVGKIESVIERMGPELGDEESKGDYEIPEVADELEDPEPKLEGIEEEAVEGLEKPKEHEPALKQDCIRWIGEALEHYDMSEGLTKYAMGFLAVENHSLNPRAFNPKSTARGMCQFLEGSWFDFVVQNPSLVCELEPLYAKDVESLAGKSFRDAKNTQKEALDQVLDLRYNPQLSIYAMVKYIKDAARALGYETINDENISLIYVTYYLGIGGGCKLIRYMQLMEEEEEEGKKTHEEAARVSKNPFSEAKSDQLWNYLYVQLGGQIVATANQHEGKIAMNKGENETPEDEEQAQ